VPHKKDDQIVYESVLLNDKKHEVDPRHIEYIKEHKKDKFGNVKIRTVPVIKEKHFFEMMDKQKGD